MQPVSPAIKLKVCNMLLVVFLIYICFMDNSLNQKFDTLLSKYISIIEKSLQQRLRKAKNKEFVALEITKEIALVNEMIIHNDVVDAMLDLFRKDYLRG